MSDPETEEERPGARKSGVTTTDIQDYLAGHMGGDFREDYEVSAPPCRPTVGRGSGTAGAAQAGEDAGAPWGRRSVTPGAQSWSAGVLTGQ